MFKIILTFLSLLFCTFCQAVPAKRVKRTFTMPDGSLKTVTMRGDENMHFYEAEDGKMFHEDDMGALQPLGNDVLEKWQHKVRQRNARRKTRANFVDNTEDRQNFVGSKKGIVILVEFDDREMRTTSVEEFDNYFNKSGYHNSGMQGSVHDYFYDNSYGKFDLTFDVVGPVKLSKSITYYGKNNSSGDDMYAAEMVIEAVRLADKLGVDFSEYDWDYDGFVDQVYVIYAGYGESNGAPAYTIWPHEYELYAAEYYGDGSGPVYTDGVVINTYACSNELDGTRGNQLAGIGTACHEFAHCLGLPDLYDTSGAGNFGMDVWSLMDYGCYNDNSRCPCGFTSYERWYCGWLEPVELDKGCFVSDMPCLSTSPTAYVIYNQADHNEYYLLENRQLKSWFSKGQGHGMLVIHVDYQKSFWDNNTLNNESNHQRFTVIPADNKLLTDDANLAGDPYPGTSKNTKLTDNSKPAAKLFRRNTDRTLYMNRPITEIDEDLFKHTISFTFNGGETPEPDVILSPKDNSKVGYDWMNYRLNGLPATEGQKGVIIRNGKKYLSD